MKSKADENNSGQEDAEETTPNDEVEDGSANEELDSEEPERFERPDNLRRRAEWFQKRTGRR